MKIEGFVTRAEAGLVKAQSISRNITPENGGLTVHHAGKSQQISSHADCFRRWRGYQKWHMDNGYADIAYNVGWCQHGYVFAGRGAFVRSGANGTNVGNQDYYAGCWIGGEGDTPTSQSVSALEWLIHEYRTTGRAGKRVVPHSFHKNTQCPGIWKSLITKYDNKEFEDEVALSEEDLTRIALKILRYPGGSSVDDLPVLALISRTYRMQQTDLALSQATARVLDQLADDHENVAKALAEELGVAIEELAKELNKAVSSVTAEDIIKAMGKALSDT